MACLEHFQVGFLVKLHEIVRHAIGQEFGPQGHEQAIVASAVIDQCVHEFGRHQRRVAGFRQGMADTASAHK